MVHRRAAGQSVMDEHQQLLKQHAPLWPTGIPNGWDEVFGSIRYGRQTRQVPQRRGHDHQTRMCSHGCGTPHAVRVEAQWLLAGLSEGCRRPPVPIQANTLVWHEFSNRSRNTAAWSLTTGAGATIGNSIRHPLVLVRGFSVPQG